MFPGHTVYTRVYGVLYRSWNLHLPGVLVKINFCPLGKELHMKYAIFFLATVILTGCATSPMTARSRMDVVGPITVVERTTTTTTTADGKTVSSVVEKSSTKTAPAGDLELKLAELKGRTQVGVAKANSPRNNCSPLYGCGSGMGGGFGGGIISIGGFGGIGGNAGTCRDPRGCVNGDWDVVPQGGPVSGRSGTNVYIPPPRRWSRGIITDHWFRSHYVRYGASGLRIYRRLLFYTNVLDSFYIC